MAQSDQSGYVILAAPLPGHPVGSIITEDVAQLVDARCLPCDGREVAESDDALAQVLGDRYGVGLHGRPCVPDLRAIVVTQAASDDQEARP